VRASTAPWLKKLRRWHRREPGEDGVGPWSDRYEEFVACWEDGKGFRPATAEEIVSGVYYPDMAAYRRAQNGDVTFSNEKANGAT
jgi:hypothetical protein